MADTILLTGCVTGAHTLKVRMRREMSAQLASWRPGTELAITIEKRHATRSLDANAYYWAVIVDWLRRYRLDGWSEEDVHFYLKARFLSKRLAVCDRNGEIVDEFVVGGSTTKLNKVQFYDYVEAIRLWALESLDLDIPAPDPAWRQRKQAAA